MFRGIIILYCFEDGVGVVVVVGGLKLWWVLVYYVGGVMDIVVSVI